jgi:hypothetical protein
LARVTPEVEIVKAKAKEMFLNGRKLVDIAKHPEVSRSVSLIHHWKTVGKWEDERAANVAKKSGLEGYIKPSTKRALEKLLDIKNVDLDSATPMSEDELQSVMTVVIKTAFKQLIGDLESGKIEFKNPTQLTNFIDLILKEVHLAKGEPTEISKKTVETLILDPNDEGVALKEGVGRLIQIAERRKARLKELD